MVSLGLAAACGGRDPSLLNDELSTDACPSTCRADESAADTPHGGGVPGRACQFRLVDTDMWDRSAELIDAMRTCDGTGTTSDVVAPVLRVGSFVDAEAGILESTENVGLAFEWDTADAATKDWYPQGISGAADASPEGLLHGREVIAVSWYYDGEGPNQGVRVSFVDIGGTTDGHLLYQHVLLVTPDEGPDGPTFSPARIHAGGIAWVGPYLYVADTIHGFRVFDTTRILAVSDGRSDYIGYHADDHAYYAYGYRHVLPQVGAYELADDGCFAKFSSVSLDHDEAGPSLVSSEYRRSEYSAMVLRWPLDGDRLRTDASGVVMASEAVFSQERRVQGVASIDGTIWISAAAQLDMPGVLFELREDEPSVAHPWPVGAEDLMHDPHRDVLWCLTEFANRRLVFAVDLDRG